MFSDDDVCCIVSMLQDGDEVNVLQIQVYAMNLWVAWGWACL